MIDRARVVAMVWFAASAISAFGTNVWADGALEARTPQHELRGTLPLDRTDVHADVTGQMTSVTVRQHFHNTFPERIEAVYVFPLPDTAAVDQMEMRIGARVIRADVRRRSEARQVYQQAVDQGQHAALLEQERPNIFTFSVANIDPGSAIDVELRYFEVAKYDHGTYEMVFPTVVGPRFNPGNDTATAPTGTGTHPDTDRVTDASRISPAYVPAGVRSGHTIGLSVHLDAGSEIQTVASSAHAVDIARPSNAVADITLHEQNEIPNRDFILRWTLVAPELRTASFTYRPTTQSDGYVALLLEPRHDVPAADIASREIFFLLDTSGSMQGTPLNTATAAIHRALATLNPRDTFQIIDFADTASTFAPRPLANTPENIHRANEYLDHLVGSGGTNQLDGIHAALTAPGDAQRIRYVVFMTDGYIGNEHEVIGLVQREIGNARIFSFGIGSSVNRFLLDEVALAGRGTAEYLGPNEAADAMVERFYQRIARPYLTDISIDWGQMGIRDVYPQPVADLSAFQPLTILGRYHGAANGVVVIRGRVAGQPFERRIALGLPDVNPNNVAISRVWAREKISNLSRAMYRDGENPERVEAITSVALEHHLMSRFTSLVAVDQTATVTQGPAVRVNQPVEAPQGVNIQSAGGTSAWGELTEGDAFGSGGIGSTGTGWGGGGSGEGTIGLGTVGSIGHGAGSGQGYGSGVGYGLASRATGAGPAVRLQLPTVTGLLSPEAIRRVVMRNLGQVNHCYEQALAISPNLTGRVVVRFVVLATGVVGAVSIAESTVGSHVMEGCLSNAFRRWQFPATTGGIASISYPLTFAPPEAPTHAPRTHVHPASHANH